MSKLSFEITERYIEYINSDIWERLSKEFRLSLAPKFKFINQTFNP